MFANSLCVGISCGFIRCVKNVISDLLFSMTVLFIICMHDNNENNEFDSGYHNCGAWTGNM